MSAKSAKKLSPKPSPGGGSEPETAKWPPLESELRRLDPKTLRRREVNARFMDPGEFDRLVKNVRTDGKLTSAPLACQLEDGSIELLSGHHRTLAAIQV